MKPNVKKLAEGIAALSKEEREELLSWLAEFKLDQMDEEWDRQIERDSQPGGRLEGFLKKVRQDIADGKTWPKTR